MASSAEIRRFKQMSNGDMYAAIENSLTDMGLQMNRDYASIVVSRGTRKIAHGRGFTEIETRIFTIVPMDVTRDFFEKILWIFTCLGQGFNARNIGPFNKNLLLKTIVTGNNGTENTVENWLKSALSDCRRAIQISFSLDDLYSLDWNIELLETKDTPGCAIL